jgi:hypothetical protein
MKKLGILGMRKVEIKKYFFGGNAPADAFIMFCAVKGQELNDFDGMDKSSCNKMI